MEIGKLYQISNLNKKSYYAFINDENKNFITTIGSMIVPNNSVVMLIKIINLKTDILFVFLYKQHLLATVCLEHIQDLKNVKI